MSGEWETYGFRVSWLQGAPFAGSRPTRHSVVVDYAEDAMKQVRDVMRRKPVTQLPTYAATVTELQRRTETREVPMGVSWPEDRR